MSESWQEVVREGSTLSHALDPIPSPPSVELVDGAGELPQLRAGLVEFVLCRPDGGRIWFEREVQADGENGWVLGPR